MNIQNDIYSARQLRLMAVCHSGKNKGRAVGAIDLFDFEPHHRRAGVGILIRKEFRELGYASEALDLLIRYAFDVLSLRQLFSNMTPENTASVSLLRNSDLHAAALKKTGLGSATGGQRNGCTN